MNGCQLGQVPLDESGPNLLDGLSADSRRSLGRPGRGERPDLEYLDYLGRTVPSKRSAVGLAEGPAAICVTYSAYREH
jgi:hypothetical protein